MLNFTKELATSTVQTAPSPATSGTSLTVQTGHGSRFGDTMFVPFYLVAHPENELPTEDNAEFLKVTSRSGDTFTIERGAPIGSVMPSAKSISAGWRVSIPVTVSDVMQSLMTFFFAFDPLDEFQIGDVLGYAAPGAYFKAKADASNTAEVIGIVEDKEGQVCKVVTSGYAQIYSGYGASDGDVLYLSDTTAGLLTTTEPTTPGHISKPVMVVQNTDGSTYTNGFVNIMRGMEIDESWGTNSFVSDATPSGLVNSSNTVYTVPSAYASGTMEVFINGLKQIRDTDYTETNPTAGSLTMTTAPTTGDIVRVNYMTSGFGTGNADTLDGYQAADFAAITPSGGGYNTYTATFNGFTLGNGTQYMHYQRIGKLVTVFGIITLGSTSVMTGELRVSTPTTIDTNFANRSGTQATVRFLDTSANTSYQGIAVFSTAEMYIRAINASGTYDTHTAITSAIPFTWADTDYIRIFVQYIEA